LKEHRKKKRDEGHTFKRVRQSTSSAEDTFNSPSQNTPKKNKESRSPS